MAEDDQQQQADGSSQPQQSAKHSLDKKLIEPYHYISVVPGKDIRGKLINWFNLLLLLVYLNNPS